MKTASDVPDSWKWTRFVPGTDILLGGNPSMMARLRLREAQIGGGFVMNVPDFFCFFLTNHLFFKELKMMPKNHGAVIFHDASWEGAFV